MGSFDFGDLVFVKTKEYSIEGFFVENPDENVLVIKLKSGYNIGIDKKDVVSVKVLEKFKGKNVSVKKEVQDKSLPKVSLIHTGGTIASKVDYKTGGVIAKISEGELLELYPELKDFVNVKTVKLFNLQSEMMRFHHFNEIIKAVVSEVNSGVDGVIVSHGTDFMHYSSAALSFALDNLGVPVLFVGSQRSSDRGSTDARLNLLSAAFFIANSDFSGVGLCMHENTSDTSCFVLPGLKSRKMHTSRRDAFRPINTDVIAKVSYEEGKIDFLSKYEKKNKRKKVGFKLFNEKLKIGFLKNHPNMCVEELERFSDFDGLVLEGSGLGHLQNLKMDKFTLENEKIQKCLEKMCKKVFVVVSSQCVYGRVNLNVYSPLRLLKGAGVSGHLSDMTSETAFIKVAWLLSNYKRGECGVLFEKNLKGEISDRSTYNQFLI